MNKTLSILTVMQQSWAQVKGSKAKFFTVTITFTVLSVFIQLLTRLLPTFGIRSSIATPVSQASSVLVDLASPLALEPCLQYFGLQKAASHELTYDMLKKACNVNITPKIMLVYLFKWLILAPGVLLATAGPLSWVGFNFFQSASSLVNAGAITSFIIGIMLTYYLHVRMSFATAIVLTQNSGAWSAVKSSFHVTQTTQLELLVLYLMNYLLIWILGLLTLGIGLIWLVPYLYITHGVLYWQLAQPMVGARR